MTDHEHEQNEHMFVEELKQALDNSGIGRVMSDDEFEAWCKAWDSPESRVESAMDEAILTYYLDKVAKYKFTDEMGEISGLGGGYEKACRVMLDSGLQWLDANPDAEPKFKKNSGIYGLILEDNDDAKALSDAVIKHVDVCSGAVHHATVGACLWIKENGWDAYIDALADTKEVGDE